MDLWQHRHDVLVKQLFGASAQLAGSIGSSRAPGELHIVVGGVTLGSGGSFAQVLADVTHRSERLLGGLRGDSRLALAAGLRDCLETRGP